ncbi:MAG: hypothetical protein L3J52_01215 [Proteobacteria bacterium]|nr:hypothetical protein [Pseudomonadota bacterium]
MKKTLIVALMSISLSACSGVFGSKSVEAGTNSPDKDLDSVNGSIRVGAGSHIDDLSTVNGSVIVAENSTVGSAETVNGSITFSTGVTADSVETVNGSIKLGEDCMIKGDVETVNGSITAKSGCTIKGNYETVNGKLSADKTLIEGDIEMVNGKVYLENGTVLEGDLIVRKSSGFFNSSKKMPEITIGKDVVVKGDLIFERPVKLYLHDSAKVGDIEGDDVEIIKL